MTSMPASMKALARTLAPRSCPSRPGFATRTLIFSSIVSSLERRVRPILAEHGAQHVADFTKSRVRVDRVDDRRHQVCITACDNFHLSEGRFDLGSIAVTLHRTQLLVPLLIESRVDVHEILEWFVLDLKLVDPDDDLLA